MYVPALLNCFFFSLMKEFDASGRKEPLPPGVYDLVKSVVM